MANHTQEEAPTLSSSAISPSEDSNKLAPKSIASIENVAPSSVRSRCDQRASGQKTATASGTDSTASANPTHNPQEATPASPTGNIITALIESSHQLNFAENLHSILSVPDYHCIVRWNPKGDAFAIYDTTAFVNTVMATHFQHSKFESFTRRMRRWGFRRIESMSCEKMRGLEVYKCNIFLREKPELCKLMCDDRQQKNRGNRNSPNTTKGVTAMNSHIHSSNKQVDKGQNEPMPVHVPSRMSVHLPIRPSISNKNQNMDMMAGPVHFPMGHPEQHYNPLMNHSGGLHQPSSLPSQVYPQRRHSMEMIDDAVNQTYATAIMPSPRYNNAKCIPSLSNCGRTMTTIRKSVTDRERTAVVGSALMKNKNDDESSDDELEEWIYNISRTGKANAEAAKRASSSNAPATNKSERLVCNNQSSMIACDMPNTNECGEKSMDDGLVSGFTIRKEKYVLNKRKLSVEKDDGPVPLKRGRKRKCSIDNCAHNVVTGEVCIRHGAKVKTCSHEGCTNIVVKGGVCIRHGAKVKVKTCSHEGCTNIVKKGGVCVRHGAKVKTCSHEGCTNNVKKGGVCMRHGAKVKTCNHEGCTNHVVKGGVCVRHGAKVKTCSHEGCTNNVIKGGVCMRHGAKVKTCNHDGCTNIVKKGGVCVRHGAKVKVKSCSHEGCTNKSKKGGVCIRHGAKTKTCSHEGCTLFDTICLGK